MSRWILLIVFSFCFELASAKDVFDKPIKVEKLDLVPDPINPKIPRDVTCSYFPTYVVKVFNDGGKGAGLSLLPASTSECKEGTQEGEFKIEDWSGYFLGAKKDYAFFEGDDSSLGGGTAFMMIRPKDHKAIFSDELMPVKDQPFKSILVGKKAVQLTYRRNYNTNCSVALDPENCVARIVKRTHLPKSFTKKCLAAYAKHAELIAKDRCGKTDKDCFQKELKIIKEGQDFDASLSFISYDVVAFIPASSPEIDLKNNDFGTSPNEAAPYLLRKSDVIDCNPSL